MSKILEETIGAKPVTAVTGYPGSSEIRHRA